jgi:hypothetical protein
MFFFPHLHAFKRVRGYGKRAKDSEILSPRGNEDGNNDRGNNHNAPKHYKPDSKKHFLKVSYLTDRVFRGSIKSNDSRTKLQRGHSQRCGLSLEDGFVNS